MSTNTIDISMKHVMLIFSVIFLFVALPTIRNSPMNQTNNETDSAEFSCGGDGIPMPQVIWQKVDGNVIQNTSDYVIKNIDKPYNFRMSYLTINNLEYADRGKYSCTLMNRKSEDVKAPVLVVQGKNGHMHVHRLSK